MSTQEVVMHVLDAKAEQVEREADRVGDWTDETVRLRYVDVLRSVAVWATSERRIVAEVMRNRDGKVWANVAAELLDSTADVMPDTAVINKVDDWTYELTW